METKSPDATAVQPSKNEKQGNEKQGKEEKGKKRGKYGVHAP